MFLTDSIRDKVSAGLLFLEYYEVFRDAVGFA
jgi:hypothetical protein